MDLSSTTTSPLPAPRATLAAPLRLVPPAPERRADADMAAAGGALLLLRVLDHLDYGVMLVDATGRVRFANRMAWRACGGTRGVRVADGRLQARHERDQQRLMRALAATLGGRRSLVLLAASGEPCALAVVPVHEAPAALPGEPPALLVVFGRRDVCEPLTVEFFAREHALTPAETGVLRALARGLRPSQIARDAGVELSTVRTQIASIRLKTGARSIGDLLRLVTVLPPILPLLSD